eukprot:CAMPEP_0185770826 /NCGR_PEP_ID=MMETSP1174-20130828/61363_1 /TAXON_ID=35687 /ORGANISM="Dictyocha speculum, Strain CCMP1381" /LENGTH=121 /DNA_ID=CAMNT_0028456425 /DNA_START=97 /DNA_END=462 /DNA_ORIENTATION=-
MTSGQSMLNSQTWAVVGDALNEKKPAFDVAERLRQSGKVVYIVDPREKEGRCFTSLSDCPQPVDVVDLIISPRLGPTIIDEMQNLGIQNVFIQPGASSQEILEKCGDAGIEVHHGCVLREL